MGPWKIKDKAAAIELCKLGRSVTTVLTDYAGDTWLVGVRYDENLRTLYDVHTGARVPDDAKFELTPYMQGGV